MRIRIHQVPAGKVVEHDDHLTYLRTVILRFANPIHAATRTYTCRGPRTPFELHWNASEVPGEVELPSSDDVTRELEAGRPVRLFHFNSDSDLCFQEVIEPA